MNATREINSYHAGLLFEDDLLTSLGACTDSLSLLRKILCLCHKDELEPRELDGAIILLESVIGAIEHQSEALKKQTKCDVEKKETAKDKEKRIKEVILDMAKKEGLA